MRLAILDDFGNVLYSVKDLTVVSITELFNLEYTRNDKIIFASEMSGEITVDLKKLNQPDRDRLFNAMTSEFKKFN